MVKINDFITAAMRAWQQPTDPAECIKFLANCYRARLDEFDKEWHDSRINAESWVELRAKRQQLMECFEMLAAVQNVLAGKPAVAGAKPKTPPIGMYGEI